MERKLRQFTMSHTGAVKVQFVEEIIIAGSKRAKSSEDEDEDDDATSQNKYGAESQNQPHKDLLGCLTILKKHALDICEIGVAGKELATWSVSGIKVAGDVSLKKSRVQLRLSKYVKRTKKTVNLWSPQITMYPDIETVLEYNGTDKMTPVVEELIDEIFKYLGGKYEQTGQLALFPDRKAA